MIFQKVYSHTKGISTAKRPIFLRYAVHVYAPENSISDTQSRHQIKAPLAEQKNIDYIYIHIRKPFFAKVQVPMYLCPTFCLKRLKIIWTTVLTFDEVRICTEFLNILLPYFRELLLKKRNRTVTISIMMILCSFLTSARFS